MCFSFEGMMRLGRFQCLSTWACFFFSLTGHWLSGSSQQLNSRVVPVQLSGYFIVCKVSCWLKLIALPVENLTLLLFCIHFLFSFFIIYYFFFHCLGSFRLFLLLLYSHFVCWSGRREGHATCDIRWAVPDPLSNTRLQSGGPGCNAIDSTNEMFKSSLYISIR